MTIALILGGVALIALIAVVVGVVDAAHSSRWRRVAAERRDQWEARRPEFHGGYEAWDED